ncbi:uncharacterized protein [Dermacentor andersoni]|uniref:uncharacterized protein n=1 Tax=Dermacentor andersoni TaxID=34620 RepID=UPI002417C4E6|nr:uncharacterized protein LOC126528582 [Dermacentor andersoni]
MACITSNHSVPKVLDHERAQSLLSPQYVARTREGNVSLFGNKKKKQKKKDAAMPDKSAKKRPSRSRRSPSASQAARRGSPSKRRGDSPVKQARSSPSKSRSSPMKSRSSSPSPAKAGVASPSRPRRAAGSSSPRPSRSPRAAVSSSSRPSPKGELRLFRAKLDAAAQRHHERRNTLYQWLKSLTQRKTTPPDLGSPRRRHRGASRSSPGLRSPPSSGSLPRGHKRSPTQSTHEPSPSRANYGGDARRRGVWAPLLVLAVITAGAVALAVMTARYLRGPAASTLARCHGETCRRYEELLANAMDPEAQPCDNFYAHVCGTWIKAGRRAVYEVNWDRFLVEIAKRTADFTPRTGSDQEPVDKAVAYIRACLSPLERDNMPEVRAVLAAAGVTWPQPDPEPDFLSVMFLMSRHVYHPVFIAVDVDTMEGPRTLMLSFGGQFPSTYEQISQHVTTIHAKQHFRVTYESLAPMNETRLDELFDQFIVMKRFLDNHTPMTDDGHSSADPASFLQWTPSVPESRWDEQTRRFLDSPLRRLGGCFIDHVGAFKALFELHAAFGENKMANFVGFFAVQALVGFGNIRLLESFYGASDVATEEQRKYCVMTAYQMFAYAIDSFLETGTKGALTDVNTLVGWVEAAFGRLLRATDDSSSLGGDPTPEPLHLNLNQAFSILNYSRREVTHSIYAGYPEMVMDAPLSNSINASAYMQATQQMASASGQTGQTPYQGYQAFDATIFNSFRLNPQLLVFPWYEADAHVGVLLGGLGARLAAAVFYDYVERNNGSGSALYAENQRCLSPKNETSGSKSNVDTDLQGAVAAAAVVADVYKEVAGSGDRAWTQRESPPPWTGESVAFAFFCWLNCGDAERGPSTCNTAAMHSRDFGRVFGCPAGSRMNPVKKCRLKV